MAPASFTVFDWLTRLLLPSTEPDGVQSMVVIMMAIAAGVFLGRLRLARVALGTSGVMFSGLLLGHLGYRIDAHILHFVRDLGLIFFVYAVGLQVGPSFFSSFRRDGLRLNLLAGGTVLAGALVALGIHALTQLPAEHVVGILSGSVTNTPGLGAAKSTLAEIARHDPARQFADPALAYAVTYPLGVLGIILVLIGARVVLRIDPLAEQAKLGGAAPSGLVHKKARVMHVDVVGLSLRELIEATGGKVLVSRLKHSGDPAVYAPPLDTRLRPRDVLMLVGTEADVDRMVERVGRLSTDAFIEADVDVTMKNLFVTRKNLVHKRLADLNLWDRYDLKVTRVVRAGREMLARPEMELFYGDILRVVGSQTSIAEAARLVGNTEKKLLEPDFLALFGGLLAGVVLGSIPLALPGLPAPIKLGYAAGPLIVALLISRFGGTPHLHGYFNNGAIHFMKELGICLFFAVVGVHAGHGFWDTFVHHDGMRWLAWGACITFIPLMLMALIGRLVLKLNFLELTGAMSGAYTDPAALSFATGWLRSEVPLQSYATVYPLVTILRIFSAQMLVLLLV